MGNTKTRDQRPETDIIIIVGQYLLIFCKLKKKTSAYSLHILPPFIDWFEFRKNIAINKQMRISFFRIND